MINYLYRKNFSNSFSKEWKEIKMKESFIMLSNNIKHLVNQANFWRALIFAGELVIIFLVIYTYLDASDDRYHFYMNTKTSLESVHQVKIDKYDGSIQRDLTTEEQLIRKKCQRWHLRQMFK